MPNWVWNLPRYNLRECRILDERYGVYKEPVVSLQICSPPITSNHYAGLNRNEPDYCKCYWQPNCCYPSHSFARKQEAGVKFTLRLK